VGALRTSAGKGGKVKAGAASSDHDQRSAARDQPPL